MNQEILDKRIAVVGIGGVGGYLAGMLGRVRGHLTMAATQLTGVGIEEGRRLLKGAIRNVMERALPVKDS